VSRIEALREALLEMCRRTYGESLVSLAIFGSWARGTATPESDIDLLLIAEKLPPSRGKRLDQFERIEAATEEIRRQIWESSPAASSLSPVIKTTEEFKAGSPLYLDMTEWCEVLFDRDSFLARALERLRQRMKELGTRRCSAKGGYYWEYKPDLKPGEVVEL
jgi:predicted nucleotidyltransferase